MKRHPSLVPLSHDHHDILVLAHNLIRGQSRAPRSDWPTDPQAQAERVLTFYDNTLVFHFDAEEDLLFPAAIRTLQPHTELIGWLTRDHDHLRVLVSDLRQEPCAELEDRLPVLGRRLERHVRLEERVLFQTLQRDMPAAELVAIGSVLSQQLRRAPVCSIPDGP